MKTPFYIFATFFLLGLLVTSSWAAVTPNSVVTAQTPRAYKVQLANASGTTAQTLAAGAANGTKVMSVVCSNTDAAAGYAIQLSVLRSTVSYVMTTVTVAASSGNVAGTVPTNLLSAANTPGLPVDSDGNPYLFLESTDTLQAASGTTITLGKVVSCHTVAADF